MISPPFNFCPSLSSHAGKRKLPLGLDSDSDDADGEDNNSEDFPIQYPTSVEKECIGGDGGKGASRGDIIAAKTGDCRHGTWIGPPCGKMLTFAFLGCSTAGMGWVTRGDLQTAQQSYCPPRDYVTYPADSTSPVTPIGGDPSRIDQPVSIVGLYRTADFAPATGAPGSTGLLIHIHAYPWSLIVI